MNAATSCFGTRNGIMAANEEYLAARNTLSEMAGRGGKTPSTLVITVDAEIGRSEIVIAAWICVLAPSIEGGIARLQSRLRGGAGAAECGAVRAVARCVGTQARTAAILIRVNCSCHRPDVWQPITAITAAPHSYRQIHRSRARGTASITNVWGLGKAADGSRTAPTSAGGHPVTQATR